MIRLETECSEASKMIGLSFRGERTSIIYPSGCFFDIDNQKSYFNRILDIATTYPGRLGYYAGVCNNEGN